jgi:hypothetical protein
VLFCGGFQPGLPQELAANGRDLQQSLADEARVQTRCYSDISGEAAHAGRGVLFAQFLLARGLKRAEHVGTISMRCELGPVSQKGAERFIQLMSALKVLASKLVEQIRPGAEVK